MSMQYVLTTLLVLFAGTAFAQAPEDTGSGLLQRYTVATIVGTVGFSALDRHLTGKLLSDPRYEEANPTMKWLAKRPAAHAAAGIAVDAAIAGIFLTQRKRHPRMVAIASTAVLAARGAIAFHNWRLYQDSQRRAR